MLASASRFSIEPLTKPTEPVPLEPPHDQRVVIHCLGLFDEIVQLRIVLVGRTVEPRAYGEVFRVFQVPSRTFEVQHRSLPFGDHGYRLAATEGKSQAPSTGFFEDDGAGR